MSNWEEKLKYYDKLVSAHGGLERKGKTVPYTSANGHMFSLFNKDGEIGIRLPKASGEAFMAKHDTTRFKSHGAFMRGYVLIPERLYDDMDLLVRLLDEGYRYVMSLEPGGKKK